MTIADDDRVHVREWAEAALRNGAPRAAFFLTYAEAFMVDVVREVRTEPKVIDERLSPFLYAMQ